MKIMQREITDSHILTIRTCWGRKYMYSAYNKHTGERLEEHIGTIEECRKQFVTFLENDLCDVL